MVDFDPALPDTAHVGDSGHTDDHNAIVAALNALNVGLESLDDRVVALETGRPAPILQPILIEMGWDSRTATQLAAGLATFEQQPFNGVVFLLDSSRSEQIMSQTPISQATLETAMAAVKAATFTTFEHNFVKVYSTPAGDVFDDWTTPIANFANLAAACADAGNIEGIFFDIEEYFGNALTTDDDLWLEGTSNNTTHTTEQGQAQAQSLGSQIMAAMIAEWPEMVFICTHGPWMTDVATDVRIAPIPCNNAWESNLLKGPFLVGMIEAVQDTAATFVDGGEMYGCRTKSEFDLFKWWQKAGMAQYGTIIPTDLRPDYADLVSAGFGVFDTPIDGAGMDVTIWQSSLTNALTATDKYVWAYAEQFDWWGGGGTPVPQSWIDATAAALAPFAD